MVWFRSVAEERDDVFAAGADPLAAVCMREPRARPGADPGILTPTILPDQALLEAAAAAAPLLMALDGDATAVDPALVRTIVEAGGRGDGAPLDRLGTAVDAYLRAGPVARLTTQSQPERWRRAADRRLPVLLLTLYELPDDAAVTPGDLALLAAPGPESDLDAPAGLLRAAIQAVVDELATAGLLTVRTPGPVVALTDLGRWYVHGLLGRAGFVAPLAGEVADLDAEHLLRAAARWDVGVAGRELAAWAHVRGPRAAVAEVAEAVHATRDPLLTAGAPLAFAAAGAEAAPHVRALAADPDLRPAVLLWAQDGGDDCGPATPDDLLAMLALRAYGAWIRGGSAAAADLLERAAPNDLALAAILHRLLATGSRHVVDLVDALAEHAPTTVARAARAARARALS